MITTRQLTLRALSSFALVATVALNSFATPTADTKKPAGMNHPKPAAEKAMASKDVLSDAASASFKKNFPTGIIKSVKAETNGTAKVYHVMAMDGKSEHHLMIQEDGTIVSNREHLALAQLPKAVVDAIRKSMPDAKIDRAAKVFEGTAFHYGVTVQDKGNMKELMFDEQGNVVSK